MTPEFKTLALTLLGKGILAGKRLLHAAKTKIPTHIQTLLWFNIDARGAFQETALFEVMSPHYLWLSRWDETGDAAPERQPMKEFPTNGFFLWVIWDAKLGARRYICLRASEFKDVFYDIQSINDLFALQDRAILKRIRTFTFMDSIIHRKDHKLMDATVVYDNGSKVPILKPLLNHLLEESIYIPKNLTGNALLWLYLYIHHALPDSGELTAGKLVLTDYELEERTIDLNEPIFP